ncbi:MAG TPA: hypothetical protein DCZ34_03510 [Clostridiales bacterium]|nr:hypothetical protein [Clostridiales bacterium]
MKKIYYKFISMLILIFSTTSFMFGFMAINISQGEASKNHQVLASETQISNDDANFTNLIVFATFSDEDEFIDNTYDSTTVRQLIDNTYSNCEYNISDYFYAVSNGKIKMQNVYLFQNNHSLQLSNPRGYYAIKDDDLNPNGYESGQEALRRLDLIDDWTNAVNNAFASGAKPTSIDCKKTYSISDLDKNNDGIIDAITIIYKNTTQNISVSWNSPLWNYQYTTNAVSVEKNGKTLQSSAYVQLTFTYENTQKTLNYIDSNGTRFLSPATAMHETSHIFGLLDLYRSDSSSQIYYMSLLGKPISPVGQFISNKEREAMGWIGQNQIKTLSAEGTYRLNVTSSNIVADDVLAYKLKLQNTNKVLYLEYRNFKGTQNKFDSQKKQLFLSNGDTLKQIYLKSGLICYLANADMKIPTNLNTTGSNWNYLALGGTQSTKSDCAVGENESIYITETLNIEVNTITDTYLEFSIYGDELKNNTHTHELTHVAKVEPTCISEGNIEYYHCSICDKYYLDQNATNEIEKAQTILQKTNHNIVVLPSQEATCTNTGLTEGERCSTCGKIIKQQTIIAKKPHSISDWIIDTQPTTETKGHKHKECVVCHTTIKEAEVDKLPSHETNPDIDDDNNKPDQNANKLDTASIILISIAGIITLGGTFAVIKIIKKKKQRRF